MAMPDPPPMPPKWSKRASPTSIAPTPSKPLPHHLLYQLSFSVITPTLFPRSHNMILTRRAHASTINSPRGTTCSNALRRVQWTSHVSRGAGQGKDALSIVFLSAACLPCLEGEGGGAQPTMVRSDGRIRTMSSLFKRPLLCPLLVETRTTVQ